MVLSGVLVRMSVEQVCQLAELLCHPLQPILTVRTDLMRYALSNYPESGHHQWDHSYKPPVKVYSIATLSATANSIIKRWVHLAAHFETLEACGLEPILAHYEQISDDAEKALATGVVAALEQTSGLKFPRRTEVEAGKEVVKIHSDHISRYYRSRMLPGRPHPHPLAVPCQTMIAERDV